MFSAIVLPVAFSGIVTFVTLRSELKHCHEVYIGLTMTPIRLGYTNFHDLKVF